MADPALVREWIEKAESDFRFAEVNLGEGKDFFSQICFHFHQAAEKYLKAFIVHRDLEFRKTHDLTLLHEICKEHEPALGLVQEDAEFLNGFYIDTRYPVHWPAHYTRKEAEKAYEAAAEIGRTVKKLLGGVFG